LPDYEHIMLAKKHIRVVVKGKSGFVCEDEESFMKRVDDIDADVTVSMNPNNKRFLRNKKRSIVRFSGMRALQGWHR
jgi:hypothetical protein